jgi:hypothetical protein
VHYVYREPVRYYKLKPGHGHGYGRHHRDWDDD